MQSLRNIFLLLLLCPLLSSRSDLPVNAIAKNGNIFLLDNHGQEKQLTYTNKDSSPTLSPDFKNIAFLREINIPETDSGRFFKSLNEIWLYDIQTNKEQLIVHSTHSDEPEQELSGFNDLNFSPDGLLIYFTSNAWATSTAIHCYDLATKTEKFISSGNSLKVIKTGKYKSFLIASKHKYYKKGGSYDHYWLLTKEGKEVRDLGDEDKLKDAE